MDVRASVTKDEERVPRGDRHHQPVASKIESQKSCRKSWSSHPVQMA